MIGRNRPGGVPRIVADAGLGGAAAASWVSISSDGHYLQDASGNPFFLVGDAAWSLFNQLSDDDLETYLNDRAARGFNAIVCEFVEHKFCTSAPADYYGNAPFLSAGDFSQPNESFWSRLDVGIKSAAAKGLLVLGACCYLGINASDEGWQTEVTAASSATMRGYGHFLGHRYRGQPNLVWVLGGDLTPSQIAGMGTKVDDIAGGLADAGVTQPITYHAKRNDSSRIAVSSSWLTLNAVYIDPTTAAANAATEYARTPAMPCFLIEDYYENEHTVSQLTLRSQAYWSVLHGCIAGRVFGNDPIWSFNASAASSFADSATTWQASLGLTGTTCALLLGRLFKSRRFHLLVPDTGHTVTTAGYSSGTSLCTTARASDGSSVIAYLPTGSSTPITVDMTKVGGTTARCWWFNPRDGSTSSAHADASTSGTLTFTASDTNDWVLVLDNLAVYTTAPG